MHRLTVAAMVAAVLGCGAQDAGIEDRTATPAGPVEDVLPVLAALLDSAATAYGAGEYAEARRIYEGAVHLDSTLAAPWFGMYMAGRALGDAVMADSALKHARRLAMTAVGRTPTGTRAP